jgi:hypothetical protein
MVYLSRGIIWASVGISAVHRSSDLSVSPFFANALATVATTWSTAFNRLRCRNFWVGERRHGIFLRRVSGGVLDCGDGMGFGGAHHSRPPLRGFVIRNGPNIFGALRACSRSAGWMGRGRTENGTWSGLVQKNMDAAAPGGSAKPNHGRPQLQVGTKQTTPRPTSYGLPAAQC